MIRQVTQYIFINGVPHYSEKQKKEFPFEYKMRNEGWLLSNAHLLFEVNFLKVLIMNFVISIMSNDDGVANIEWTANYN